MAVNESYLEATAVMAAAARAAIPALELLVNLSQMTCSEMSLASTTESRQQKLHWLGE